MWTCKFTFDELCPHLGTMLKCHGMAPNLALGVLEKATAQERAPFIEMIGELLEHGSFGIYPSVCRVLAVCNTEERRPYVRSAVQQLHRYNSCIQYECGRHARYGAAFSVEV